MFRTINNTTLDKLNKYGFGTDIDSLESYMIDFKQASIVSDLSDYREEYNILYNILRDVKPASVVLNKNIDIPEINDEKSELLAKHKNHEFSSEFGLINKMYGYDNILGNQFLTRAKDSNCNDVIGIVQPRGLSIDCIFIYGSLYKIYCVNSNKIRYDITDYLKESLGIDAIIDFEDFERVELRGTLILRDGVPVFRKNTECSVMEYIRLGICADKLRVLFDDIVIKDDPNIEMPFKNQWDKLEYLCEAVGQELVAPYYLSRDISLNPLKNILQSISNSVDKSIKDEVIKYNYSGIEIRLSEDIYCDADYSYFMYVTDDVPQSKVFESVIRSYRFDNIDGRLIPIINIAEVKYTDKLSVNSIEIDDVFNIDKYNLYPGTRVRFRIVHNKAILSMDD